MLAVCPHCHRHIRASERACPFCRSAPGRPIHVLAAVAFAAVSCGGNVVVTSSPTTDSATQSSSDTSQTVATDSTGAADSNYTIAVPYGVVAPPDTEADADADADDTGCLKVVGVYQGVTYYCPPDATDTLLSGAYGTPAPGDAGVTSPNPDVLQ
jgi:hypothetical protein